MYSVFHVCWAERFMCSFFFLIFSRRFFSLTFLAHLLIEVMQNQLAWRFPRSFHFSLSSFCWGCLIVEPALPDSPGSGCWTLIFGWALLGFFCWASSLTHRLMVSHWDSFPIGLGFLWFPSPLFVGFFNLHSYLEKDSCTTAFNSPLLFNHFPCVSRFQGCCCSFKPWTLHGPAVMPHFVDFPSSVFISNVLHIVCYFLSGVYSVWVYADHLHLLFYRLAHVNIQSFHSHILFSSLRILAFFCFTLLLL